MLFKKTITQEFEQMLKTEKIVEIEMSFENKTSFLLRLQKSFNENVFEEIKNRIKNSSYTINHIADSEVFNLIKIYKNESNEYLVFQKESDTIDLNASIFFCNEMGEVNKEKIVISENSRYGYSIANNNSYSSEDFFIVRKDTETYKFENELKKYKNDTSIKLFTKNEKLTLKTFERENDRQHKIMINNQNEIFDIACNNKLISIYINIKKIIDFNENCFSIKNYGQVEDKNIRNKKELLEELELLKIQYDLNLETSLAIEKVFEKKEVFIKVMENLKKDKISPNEIYENLILLKEKNQNIKVKNVKNK